MPNAHQSIQGPMKQKIATQIQMNWWKSEREKFLLSRFSSVCTRREKFPRLWHFKFWHNLPLTVNSIALLATWWFWSFGPYFFSVASNFCSFRFHSFNSRKRSHADPLSNAIIGKERLFFVFYMAWQAKKSGAVQMKTR